MPYPSFHWKRCRRKTLFSTTLDIFVKCANPLHKGWSKSVSLEGLKQEISTHSVKGFLKINTNHFAVDVISLRELHNIFYCSYCIKDRSAFYIRTLVIVYDFR